MGQQQQRDSDVQKREEGGPAADTCLTSGESCFREGTDGSIIPIPLGRGHLRSALNIRRKYVYFLPSEAMVQS